MDVLKIIMCTFFIDVTVTQWNAVGRSQSFFCDAPKDNLYSFSWEKEEKQQCDCDYSSLLCTPASDDVSKLYGANITVNDTSSTTVFTIKSIELLQHNTSWFCKVIFKSGISYFVEYKLYVFATAETPSCDNPTLRNTDSSIALNCFTERVFPEAICMFYTVTNGTVVTELNSQSIIYKNIKSNTTGYYKTDCTNIVAIDKIGRGTHQFYVIMYPNIPINIIEKLKSRSQNTTAIKIDYPKAVLSAECIANDYRKENERISCKCYDNNMGFLPTYVRWSNNSSENENLTFIAKRPSFDYKCGISNHLNWTDEITYQGNVSYPPDIQNLTLHHHEADLCEKQIVNISGVCLVSESFPEHIVNIKINDEDVTVKQKVNNSEYIFEKNINSAGIFRVTCLAGNAIFANKNVTRATLVYGPPTIPRIGKRVDNKIEFDRTLKVTAGETVIICESSGGYPPLKNLSLVCGNNGTNSTGNNTVTMILSVTTSMTPNNVTCTCIVSHESKCHENKTTIFVEILPNEITDDFTMIYIGVSIAICLVICTIVAVLIFNTMGICQLRKDPHDECEELVNNSELYFIKREDSTIDISNYPEYTNLNTTMTSATEPPKNFIAKGLERRA